MEYGLIKGGKSVELTSRSLHHAGDFAHAKTFGTLEYQVLDKMTDAFFFFSFIGTPGAHPHLYGDDWRLFRFYKNDLEFIRQLIFFDHRLSSCPWLSEFMYTFLTAFKDAPTATLLP